MRRLQLHATLAREESVEGMTLGSRTSSVIKTMASPPLAWLILCKTKYVLFAYPFTDNVMQIRKTVQRLSLKKGKK
jgi:hypothetical protein